MQVKQFEYVREVARQGSVKRAAEKLYISQQALSESIRSLEAELEFQLFQRTNRGIILTEKGEMFLHDIDTIMPIIYGWKEYKEKPVVKLLVQYALSDLLMDEKILEYLSQRKQFDLHTETLNLANTLDELLQGRPCLALLLFRASYDYTPMLSELRQSKKFVFEELVKREQAQMCIMIQTQECPVANGEMIDMQQLFGKTLVVNKDMMKLQLVKQIEQYSHRTVRGLPYTVKPVDIVAQNKNAVTFLPKFIADKNYYVKTGMLSACPMEQCVNDLWSCHLMYSKQWHNLIEPLAEELKIIFSK